MVQAKRVILCIILMMIITIQNVWAFSFIDERTQQIIKETWDAQTLSQLKNGIVAIPESAINEYINNVVPQYPDISSAHVAVHPDNMLSMQIDSKKVGAVKFNANIKSFVQNEDESLMYLSIDHKKIAGNPVTSWLFSRISISMLTKLFGNPLNGNEDYFTAKIEKNNIMINFRPFIENSPLNNISFMGNSLVQMVSIDYVTTDEGIVYLHTSFHGSENLLAFISGLFA